MKRLLGKTIILTGAAAGMGKQMALLMSQEGAQIFAVDYNTKRLEELKSESIALGVEINTLCCDLSDALQVDTVINLALEKYNKIDVLINNAGVMDNFEPVGELTDEVYEKVMAINVNAPMRLMRNVIPHFLNQGYGNIINISSIAGNNGARGGAAYTMSKHAINALTKNTAFIYAKNNIRCNCIAPGAVATNIQESMNTNKLSLIGQQTIMPGMAINPRVGEAKEIAQTAVFLASDESIFINGAIITADGGWSAY